MTVDFKELRRLVSQLSEEERKKLLEAEEPPVPTFVWNSNPLAFKAAIRFVLGKGSTTRGEVRDYLRSLGLVKDPNNKCRFGILYTKTGVFYVNDARSEGETCKDLVGLTPLGKELAGLFDDDPTQMTPIETVVCRGLQQQSAGYLLLSIVGQSPGIQRDALWAKMVKEYGGKGRYYAGYYTTLLSRLGLVSTRRTGKKVGYYLAVPEGWIGEAPSEGE